MMILPLPSMMMESKVKMSFLDQMLIPLRKDLKKGFSWGVLLEKDDHPPDIIKMNMSLSQMRESLKVTKKQWLITIR